MKRFLNFAFGAWVTAFAACEASASVFTYDFTGSESAVPSTGNPNLTMGSFSRVNVTASTSSGVFQSAGWNTGTTQDSTEYVQFAVTPSGGAGLTLSQIVFDTARSEQGANHGPYNGLIEIFQGTGLSLTSKGTQAFNLPVGTTSLTGVNFNFADFSTTANQGVTVRFYGWNAKDQNDWLRFDNVAVTLNFDATPVPEPVHYALGAFGLLFAAASVRRFYSARISPV